MGDLGPDQQATSSERPVSRRRARAPDQIYRQLRHEIVSLALKPRQYLSEQDVARRLQVSRTPVREALARLEEDGLLDIYPQFGTFVAPIRVTALLEAQFTREALECQIARRAAERATRDEAASLRRNFRHHCALVARGGASEDVYAADEATHRDLCVAAGMPGIWRIVENAKTHLDRARRLLLPDRASNDRVLAQHKLFVEAVAAGHPEDAEHHMRRHVRDILGTVDLLRSRNPAYFDETAPTGRKNGA